MTIKLIRKMNFRARINGLYLVYVLGDTEPAGTIQRPYWKKCFAAYHNQLNHLGTFSTLKLAAKAIGFEDSQYAH